MKSVKVLMAGTLAIAGISLSLAAPAAAQGAKTGVVTTLQGSANVQRVSTTDQTKKDVLPLSFRQDVYVQDRITTGDQSLVRILLGGKAVVTIREHSSLTITSTTGSDTIDITAGKIALAVAKERMNPGEQINIKTPNAVAGVRGTVVITEVSQSTASLAEQGGGVNTKITLLTGLLDVTTLGPGGQTGSNFTLNPLQTLSITGFTPPSGPRNITPQQGRAAANDYKVGLKDAPQAANSQISDNQVEQASNAAAASAGGSSGNGTSIIDKTNNNTGGAGSSDPKDHLPANCTNNCTPPPVVKTPPPDDCRSICEGRGRPALRTARPAR